MAPASALATASYCSLASENPRRLNTCGGARQQGGAQDAGGSGWPKERVRRRAQLFPRKCSTFWFSVAQLYIFCTLLCAGE